MQNRFNCVDEELDIGNSILSECEAQLYGISDRQFARLEVSATVNVPLDTAVQPKVLIIVIDKSGVSIAYTRRNLRKLSQIFNFGAIWKA